MRLSRERCTSNSQGAEKRAARRVGGAPPRAALPRGDPGCGSSRFPAAYPSTPRSRVPPRLALASFAPFFSHPAALVGSTRDQRRLSFRARARTRSEADIDGDPAVPRELRTAGTPDSAREGDRRRGFAFHLPIFDEMYSTLGRPSIPPERLLKASVLMALYSVRSDRPFCEQLGYNLLRIARLTEA